MSSSKLYLRSMFTLVLALGACGDDSGDDDDKGEETGDDSGVKNDAGRDSSTPGLDASTDANTPRDSGTSADSGRDASTPGTDAATTPDTGTPDAGTPATPLELNGCKAADYTDKSGTAPAVIKFGGTLGNNYDPKCVTVQAGQVVRFEGTFSGHNLKPGTPASANAGSPGNPITETKTQTSKDFTFAAKGTYPYYCEQHKDISMVGSIFVK